MSSSREALLAAAERSGALIRRLVVLERDEQHVRRLWLTPEVNKILAAGNS